MKVTKYEHSCLDIRDEGKRLIVDPGEYSKSLKDLSNIDVLVVTHVHGDHCNSEKISQIVKQNPTVKFYSTEEVASKLPDLNVIVPEINTPFQENGFELMFFGQNHAEIDPKTALAQNIGVLVNKILYYPGDSFVECSESYKVLACPASAPWLRVGQTIPLIENSKCETVFPMHNILLSEIGENSVYNWLRKFAERSGKQLKILKPGEGLEIG